MSAKTTFFSGYNLHFSISRVVGVPQFVKSEPVNIVHWKNQSVMISAEACHQDETIVFRGVRGETPLGQDLLKNPENEFLLGIALRAARFRDWQMPYEKEITVKDVTALFTTCGLSGAQHDWFRSHAWDNRIGLGSIFLADGDDSVFDVLSWGSESEIAVTERIIAELMLFHQLLSWHKGINCVRMLQVASELLTESTRFELIESTWARHLIRNFYFSPHLVQQQLAAVTEAQRTLKRMIGDLKA